MISKGSGSWVAKYSGVIRVTELASVENIFVESAGIVRRAGCVLVLRSNA